GHGGGTTSVGAPYVSPTSSGRLSTPSTATTTSQVPSVTSPAGMVTFSGSGRPCSRGGNVSSSTSGSSSAPPDSRRSLTPTRWPVRGAGATVSVVVSWSTPVTRGRTATGSGEEGARL